MKYRMFNTSFQRKPNIATAADDLRPSPATTISERPLDSDRTTGREEMWQECVGV